MLSNGYCWVGQSGVPACFSSVVNTRRFLTMSMLIRVSHASWRNFYLVMARSLSLWLAQVKQSQTNAPLARPNDLRRSFQTVVEPTASAMDGVQDHWMNRAFHMRFAAIITNENLKYIYETRQSAAPPSAWRFAPPPPPGWRQRLRSSSEESKTSKEDLFPENRRIIHRFLQQ